MLCDGSVHITVSGAVEAVISCEFLDVLIGGITPGRTLTIDLGSATHIDGNGIATLAVVDRIAVLHGSELRVVGCTEEAEHLLTTISPFCRPRAVAASEQTIGLSAGDGPARVIARGAGQVGGPDGPDGRAGVPGPGGPAPGVGGAC